MLLDHSQLRVAQSGIVLPFALFALLAATILSLALVKSNLMSVRIGGSSVISQEAQSSAELLLSNFLTRNPLEDPDAKYTGKYTPCSQSGDNPVTDKTIFDCRQINKTRLPTGTEPQDPAVQRLGCGQPPRTNKPTEITMGYNYNQIATAVDNTMYGSHAEVGLGVAKLDALNCTPTGQ